MLFRLSNIIQTFIFQYIFSFLMNIFNELDGLNQNSWYAARAAIAFNQCYLTPSKYSWATLSSRCVTLKYVNSKHNAIT